MSFVAGLLYLVAAFVGPLVAFVICGGLANTRQPRWVSLGAIVLGAVVSVCSVAYWYLWGLALDDADALRAVSPTKQRAMTVALSASATCVLGLIALAWASVTHRPRVSSSRWWGSGSLPRWR